jgi:hypothetical protein
MDNLVAMPIFGFQALISKGTEIGTLGIIFTAECQLTEDFCRENNLFIDPTKNKINKRGYISDKGRVRAIRLRGHDSSALFLGLDSLIYTGADLSQLKEGDQFNIINGVEICKKYVIQTQSGTKKAKVREPKVRTIVAKLFPEHIDTSHWGRNESKIDPETEIVCSLKLHGTSCRLTHQKVTTFPLWAQRLPRFLGKFFKKSQWKPLAGSRRVVKIPNEGVHFYDTDVYNQTLSKYADLIPKNWIIYGEIIGWAGEKEIQKNYAYSVPKGEHRFYVYRIAVINEDAIMVDLSWDQIVEWCRNNGLKYCPVLWRGKKKDFNPQDFMDIRYFESGYTECPKLGPNAPCDEGVVVRIEGLTPQLYKCKSPIFLRHETKQLDDGVVSIEDEESQILA